MYRVSHSLPTPNPSPRWGRGILRLYLPQRGEVGAKRRVDGGKFFASLVIGLACTPPAAAADAIPDFSGHWGKNTVDPGLPPSGQGPVTNTTHTFYMRVGDDKSPILKPNAAEAVRKAAAISRTGENFPTPSNQCWPMAPPNIWRSMGLEIAQTRDVVTILYDVDQFVRRVRIGGRHPDRVTPTWFGDSIGHYEGDTLVIDTIGIKPGRYSMVDNYGSPQTTSLHVVERIHLIDGAAAKQAQLDAERLSGRVEVDMGGASVDEAYKGPGLQVVFTVDDPAVFTVPWSASATYRRALGGWDERVCADNPHNYISGKDADVPRAEKPDF